VTVYGSLRTQTPLHLAFHLARSFDRSLLHTSNSAPCTNYFALDAWRSSLPADRSAYRLLRLCVARGLLRAQHLGVSLPRMDRSLPGTYRSAPETDYSASDTCTLYVRELLRAHTQCHLLIADFSVFSTYRSALEPYGSLLKHSRMKHVQACVKGRSRKCSMRRAICSPFCHTS